MLDESLLEHLATTGAVQSLEVAVTLVAAHRFPLALAEHRGGLVVASHDRAFLSAIGVDRWIEIGGRCACASRADTAPGRAEAFVLNRASI